MLKKIVSSILQSRHTTADKDELRSILLSKVPFLKGADHALIAEIAAAIESVDFQQGATIFSEGDPGDRMYLVASGMVQVSAKGEFVAELGEGSCFGEGALLQDGIRGATVVAVDDVTLFQLSKESFQALADKYIKLRYRMRKLHEGRTAENIEKSIERNLLKNAPFLSGAGGDLINELAELLKPKVYAKGDVLIHEGEKGNAFFLIEEGLVSVSKDGNQITQLGPGACLGEGALFSRRPCSATVTALTETSCFMLSGDCFHSIIHRYPVFGRRLQGISDRRI